MQEFLDDEAAGRWLAEFAPLMNFDEARTTAEIEKRVRLAQKLLAESRLVSVQPGSPQAAVYEQALRQLPQVEDDYRRRLSVVQPGHPLSLPDLDSLQDKLAEHAARAELGAQNPAFSGSLKLKTSPSNWGAALAMGVFGLGILGFTGFHATLMIGGMMKAVGPVALFLLLFYAIFFAAAFGMLYTGFLSGSEETVEFDGSKLTIRRKLGLIRSTKTHDIDPKVPATLARIDRASTNSKASRLIPVVQLTDTEGRPVNLAAGATDGQRQRTMEAVNAHLAGLRQGL